MSNTKRKQTILFDRIAGEIAFFFLTLVFTSLDLFLNHKKTTSNSFKRILVIKTGGIGDYLLSIPAFKNLREAYPAAEITLFIFKRNKNCLEFYNCFDNIVVIDTPGALLKFLFRFKRYDLSIDFDQYRKIPSNLSLLSYAPYRIGFDNKGKGKAYTHKISYRSDEYEAESFMNLLLPLSLRAPIKKEDLILKKSTIKVPHSVAVYAAAMKEDNRLSINDWVTILTEKGTAFTYYFVGGKADKERYDELEKELLKKNNAFRIVRTDGTLSLMGSLDLLSTSLEMLSEDGGTYHMGVVSDIPVTGFWLHGEDNMKKWGSPYAHNILFNTPLHGKNS